MKSVFIALACGSLVSLSSFAAESFTGPSTLKPQFTKDCTVEKANLKTGYIELRGLEAEKLYWEMAEKQGVEFVVPGQAFTNEEGSISCIQAGATYSYGKLLNIPYLCTNAELPALVLPVGKARAGRSGQVIGVQCRVFSKLNPGKG